MSRLSRVIFRMKTLQVTHSCQNDQQTGREMKVPNILFAIADDASNSF